MLKIFSMKSTKMLNKNYKERKYLGVSPKTVAGDNKVSGDVIANVQIFRITDKGSKKGTKINCLLYSKYCVMQYTFNLHDSINYYLHFIDKKLSFREVYPRMHKITQELLSDSKTHSLFSQNIKRKGILTKTLLLEESA